MTLAQIGRLPAQELEVWREYDQRHGFPAKRMVWTLANVGAALSAAWGNKLEPKEFIPRFETGQVSNKELIVALSALPGAKVRKQPRKAA